MLSWEQDPFLIFRDLLFSIHPHCFKGKINYSQPNPLQHCVLVLCLTLLFSKYIVFLLHLFVV